MSANGINQTFLKRIEEHIDEEDVIRRGLALDGPRLIRRCMELPGDKMSLRELAKHTGYSATYLSRIMNGHLNCSKSLYVTLSRNIQERLG